MWKLRMRHGYSPEEYYRYRLYGVSTEKAALFFPQGEYMAVRAHLYEQLTLAPTRLADKRVFYRECQKAALPVPETIADFERGDIQWWRDGLPACDLFSKEALSIAGAGATLWKYDGSLRQWMGSDGRTYDQEHLIRHLSDLSRKAPLVVQRRLTNHAELSDLGPSAVCTIRAVTIRGVESTEPSILMATFRMPGGDGVTDNFSAGGLASPIDSTQGILGSATSRALPRAHLDVPHHPATNGPIAGRKVPMWKDVRKLVIRAHKAFAAFPSVGWDVAITPGGLVLMEANYDWGVSLVQQPGGRPLGATAYPAHLLSWLDVKC
jgi:hypothetical protein